MKALADLYHAAAVFILETLKKRKVGVVALKSSHGGLLPGNRRVVKAFQRLGLAATGLFPRSLPDLVNAERRLRERTKILIGGLRWRLWSLSGLAQPPRRFTTS
jgi:hypothetical protein